MLAYSSIAHAGYLLLGLVAVGRSHDTAGASAILFYLAAYTFMNLGAFGVLVLIRNRRPFAYTLDEIAGLGRSMPLTALAMMVFMLSLTGIPPLAGFWGKFFIFTAVVAAHLTWLAVVAVIMSAVSAFYYLRVVWYMYFREAPETAARAARAAARRVRRLDDHGRRRARRARRRDLPGARHRRGAGRRAGALQVLARGAARAGARPCGRLAGPVGRLARSSQSARSAGAVPLSFVGAPSRRHGRRPCCLSGNASSPPARGPNPFEAGRIEATPDLVGQYEGSGALPVNILFLGDVFGQPGRDAVVRELPALVTSSPPTS